MQNAGSFLTGYLIGLASGLCLMFLVGGYFLRRWFTMQVRNLKEAHKQDWEELIYRLNHGGPIPEAATATGLIGLILSAIYRCITQLEKLLQNKDWNTMHVIEELRGILMLELRLLHDKMTTFLIKQRDILRDFDYKQDPENPSK